MIGLYEHAKEKSVCVERKSVCNISKLLYLTSAPPTPARPTPLAGLTMTLSLHAWRNCSSCFMQLSIALQAEARWVYRGHTPLKLARMVQPNTLRVGRVVGSAYAAGRWSGCDHKYKAEKNAPSAECTDSLNQPQRASPSTVCRGWYMHRVG